MVFVIFGLVGLLVGFWPGWGVERNPLVLKGPFLGLSCTFSVDDSSPGSDLSLVASGLLSRFFLLPTVFPGVLSRHFQLTLGIITQLIQISNQLLDLGDFGELFGEEITSSFLLLL